MDTARFFHNPDFINYVHLLYHLHVAISEGWDESPEGEAVREQLEEPGSRLSGDEIISLNGISADFYSLTDEALATPLPITGEVMADLDQAVQARGARVRYGTSVAAKALAAYSACERGLLPR